LMTMLQKRLLTITLKFEVAPVAIAKEHQDLKIGGEYGAHHCTSGPTKEYKS